MTRIIAGTAGGQRLASVPGDGTRPTTDRVKEAIFSSLESMDALEGAQVLDLYAGSGALGLEAVSRGAARVDLVESHGPAVKVIRANAASVGKRLSAQSMVGVHQAKVESFLPSLTGTVDVVLMDPPYPVTNAQLQQVLALLVPHLHEDSIILCERGKRSGKPDLPAGLGFYSHKSYGETQVHYIEVAPADSRQEPHTDSGQKPQTEGSADASLNP